MAKITRVYRQSIPAMRFIGKKYGNEDRVDGSFGAAWETWFENGWLPLLEQCSGDDLKPVYEDFSDYLGLMRMKEGEPFEYWIGMFRSEGTPAPEGFEYRDFPAGELGVCWVFGQENDIFAKEEMCADKLMEEGYEIIPDARGAYWFFERYGGTRFTTPDAEGNIILDICHFVTEA